MPFRIGFLLPSLTLFLGLLPSPASSQSLGASWAVTGVTLVDGTGGGPVANAVIVGHDDRIECAGAASSCSIPNDATSVNWSGKWIIPGLIDTHVHLNYAEHANEMRRDQLLRLAFGITTTREAGTPHSFEDDLLARQRASAPAAPEPRIVIAALVSPENRQRYGASSFADLVPRLAARGADAIKIKEELGDEDLAAVIEAAHEAKLPVFGHTWWGISHLETALAANIDGLSHMATISAFAGVGASRGAPPTNGVEFWVWSKEIWNHQDAARQDSAMHSIVTRGAWLEPLLVTEQHFTLPSEIPSDVAYLGEVPSMRAIVRPWIPAGDSGWPRVSQRRHRIGAVYAHISDFISRFHAGGGLLIAGTDGVGPVGLSLLEEIRLLENASLTPIEALQAATRNAAVALRRSDIGTIEPTKLADFVALSADPLSDPANLRRTWRVVKGGYVYDPDALLAPTIGAYQRALRSAYAWRAAGAFTVALVVGLMVCLRRALRRPAITRPPVSAPHPLG